MSLIVLENASLSFGSRVILRDIGLRIGERERVGLIGRNGSGKSTLLKVMAGQQSLEAGTLGRARNCRIGYLPQDVLEAGGGELLGSVLRTVPGRVDIEQRLAEAGDALEATDDPKEQLRLAGRLAELGEELDHFETWYSERRARDILFGLGFREADLGRPLGELSGGWKMRAVLSGLLFQRPDVLLLDEPTNHLDVPSVRWLHGFLDDCPSALVLICHDRDFMNRHVQRILSFEPEGLRAYKGDYESYRVQRASEEELLAAETANRERELRDLKRFVDRFRAKATKARQAQSRARRIKRLQREMGDKAPLEQSRELSFRFPPVARTGKDVLRLEGVAKRFGALRLYQGLDRLVTAGERIAVIGVNGVGKTTLLKLMARELAPDAGRVRWGANVEVGYYAQHHSEQLHADSTVLDEVWRMDGDATQARVRGVCGAFLFSGDEVDKKVGVLSGGERARVLLARLLIKPGNLLLMDEPTNHLDLSSSEALADALMTYDGTLVFVSHNSAFVNRLATRVWDVINGEVVEYPGNLRDYERAMAVRAKQEAKAAPAPPTKKKRNRRRKRKPKPAPPAASISTGAPTPKRPTSKKQPTPARKPNPPPKLGDPVALRARRKARKLAALERRIEELEAEQAELEPMLSDPDFYSDADVFHDALDRFEQNRRKLAELVARHEHQRGAAGKD